MLKSAPTSTPGAARKSRSRPTATPSTSRSTSGVSQLQQGQSSFPAGGNGGTESGATSFSVNGMRTRSNNFMLDGQDVNDPSVTGLGQGINNQDIVAEFRVITSQFNAEHGRAAGSVVNIVTKSGSNAFHGSAFWFHNK